MYRRRSRQEKGGGRSPRLRSDNVRMKREEGEGRDEKDDDDDAIDE